MSGRWPQNLRHLANPSEDDPIPTSGDPLTASKLLGFKESSSGDIHRKILAGFPYRAFGKLQDAFAEQQQDLPALLEFPARTLAHRKANRSSWSIYPQPTSPTTSRDRRPNPYAGRLSPHTGGHR